MTVYKTIESKNTEERREHAHKNSLYKKYALGKGNLMCNKLRQILFNLLMRQPKEVIQSQVKVG